MEQPDKEITIRVQKENRTPDWLPSKECVEHWQGVLGLLDWCVTVRMAHLKDMPDNGTAGCISTITSKKHALIQIVPEEEWADETSSNWPSYTVEQVLVHELLHLHFDVFETKPGTLERLGEEQAVHKLTLALTEYVCKPKRECHGSS